MKKLLAISLMILLGGCSASIGPVPAKTTTYTTTPAVTSTTYATPVATTTVTRY